jgi:opacity protein-like surface antigen
VRPPVIKGDLPEGQRYPVEIEPRYEHREFFEWKNVLRSDSTVASGDGKSSSNGGGLSIGFAPGHLPIMIFGAGYFGTGLGADIMLKSGRRATSDVNELGFTGGVRFYPVATKVRPYVEAGISWTRSASKYKEFNFQGQQVFAEDRTFSSLGGSYGAGLVLSLASRVGIDLGLSYDGQLKKANAGENIRLTAGFVLSLGEKK